MTSWFTKSTPKENLCGEGARRSKEVYKYTGLDGCKAGIRSRTGTLVNTEATDAMIGDGGGEVLGSPPEQGGEYRYPVKWTHLNEPSWEPQDNLRLIYKYRMSTAEKG
ncbi:LOW QUALITY PROTEIN: Chromodomain containing hypothetical protein [Phytophthora palmivora]|uniref:Chromo domain-containing protein n=1 Tax=Phytophthora palmivora TaxID=4796 RepID=A0A2P4Y799_9STRA|nr:LOW QUALITY PROTEIN: Chromodomain containing hypothetical protein [Phytophthora palmivora]